MIEQIQAPIVQSRANAAADAVARQLNTEIRTQLLASADATLLLTAVDTASGDWGQYSASKQGRWRIRGCAGRSDVDGAARVVGLHYQR